MATAKKAPAKKAAPKPQAKTRAKRPGRVGRPGIMGKKKLTPKKIQEFCEALAASAGNVTQACKEVDITTTIAYRWREENPVFAEEWDKAKLVGIEALEDEALRRAFAGVNKPVFHLGKQTATMKEYSDTLAIFLLKGAKPEKYRDNVRSELVGDGGGPVMVNDAARASRVGVLLARAKDRKPKAE